MLASLVVDESHTQIAMSPYLPLVSSAPSLTGPVAVCVTPRIQETVPTAKGRCAGDTAPDG
ncbi:hypothetical protein BRC72_07085 [Halobacteriales archaeon QH_7_66_36]|nr:MAG: hypothetical protein BRC72_07085 [Halobacteriales archaeon QH_7_66_36]